MKMSISGVFWTLFLCIYLVGGINNQRVELMYHWRNVNYENLPLDDDTYIGKYRYHIPYNNDILGVDFHAKSGLVFATVGRLRPGVPATLNAFCATEYSKGSSPYIWGFPDYQKNTLEASFYGDTAYDVRGINSRKRDKYSPILQLYNHFFANDDKTYPNSFDDFSIISTYRPIVDDKCNRLFVVDTGLLHYSANEIYNVQNPALIIFELPTNGCENRQFPVIRRVEIPKHVYKDPLGLFFITPDYQPKGSCDDVFLYITNDYDGTIIVCDFKNGDFWSLTDISMKPIVANSRMFHYPDFPYELPLGIVNVALGYPDKDGHRSAYYAPGASIGEYIVSTKLLNSPKRALKCSPNDFTLIGYRPCDSQSIKQVIDPTTGVMFFGEMQSRKIRCWNTQLPLSSDTVDVVFESDDLQCVSDISIDSNGYLWFHSNQMPIVFLTETPLDITDINSRTFRVKVTDAIKGTLCDRPYIHRRNNSSYYIRL